VCSNFEAELAEFDGEDDHVHLLVNYPLKVSFYEVVNSLKDGQVDDSKEKLLEHPYETLGWRALAAILLCR